MMITKTILLGLILVTLSGSVLADDIHTTTPTGKELVGMTHTDSRTYINGIVSSDLHSNKGWKCENKTHWTVDERDDMILKRIGSSDSDQMEPASEAIWNEYKDACSTAT